MFAIVGLTCRTLAVLKFVIPAASALPAPRPRIAWSPRANARKNSSNLMAGYIRSTPQRRSIHAASESTHDLGQVVFRRVLRPALQQRKPIAEWNDREDVVPEEHLSLDDRASHETDDLGPRTTPRVENVECGRWRLFAKRHLQNGRGYVFLA
jgi:hypothetical protein